MGCVVTETVDVVVIGLGPGGEYAASELAKAGLSVVGVDARLVGGECPYYGCVPSKMMIRAADLIAEARRIPGLAGESTVTPDFAPVAERIRNEATDNWDDKVAVDRLTATGCRFIRGRATITGAGAVSVEPVDGSAPVDLRVTRAIVVNSGTEPAVPPIPGLADTPYWTNRDAIATERVPESLCVLGGGAIGSELAQVFARFGSRVSVVEAAPRLLPLEEPESGALVAESFAADGIVVHTGLAAKAVRHNGLFAVELDGVTVEAEHLLVATGRRTMLADLGVAAIGIDPKSRFLDTDEKLRVTDGVWAIGDVTGKGAFTHMSMYQAAIAVRDILGQDGPPAEYHAVPRVTFTDPEIGAVGITEQQAREHGICVRVGSTPLPNSTRGWIHKAGNTGFIKLVEDADRGVLVGATSAGPTGGEVLSALAVAVHAQVPTDRLRHMIYAYPTFHRAIEAALAELR
jgi:pyruvate/2-oxoglutarate dehydrogenase complex dihydrolipoamide dehydrogenase (E3) component